jgi:hypothetical protein
MSLGYVVAAPFQIQHLQEPYLSTVPAQLANFDNYIKQIWLYTCTREKPSSNIGQILYIPYCGPKFT